jgi:hypothetical protein
MKYCNKEGRTTGYRYLRRRMLTVDTLLIVLLTPPFVERENPEVGAWCWWCGGVSMRHLSTSSLPPVELRVGMYVINNLLNKHMSHEHVLPSHKTGFEMMIEYASFYEMFRNWGTDLNVT